MTFAFVLGISVSTAAPIDTKAAGTLAITVSDSLLSQLTDAHTDDNPLIGGTGDVLGLDYFGVIGDVKVQVYNDYWYGYDDENWSDSLNGIMNCIGIDIYAQVSKEAYDNIANDYSSINVQGMDIPYIDNIQNGRRYSRGGESYNGQVYVHPERWDENNFEYVDDGTTYYVEIYVALEKDVSGYKITAGSGSSHTAGAYEDLTITCDGALEDLVSISVDGAVIDSANYTLVSGSTILTLKAAYLNTLSAGSHTVTFTYNDGQAVNAAFTVATQTQVTTPSQTTTTNNAPTSPKTGDYTSVLPNKADNAFVVVFIALVLVAGISLLAINYKRVHR